MRRLIRVRACARRWHSLVLVAKTPGDQACGQASKFALLASFRAWSMPITVLAYAHLSRCRECEHSPVEVCHWVRATAVMSCCLGPGISRAPGAGAIGHVVFDRSLGFRDAILYVRTCCRLAAGGGPRACCQSVCLRLSMFVREFSCFGHGCRTLMPRASENSRASGTVLARSCIAPPRGC